MLTHQQKFGKQGESAAVLHLIKNGYTILKQNYRIREGEIDIIAKDGNTIVFVEVKARHSDGFGTPKQAVTLQKQKRISTAAWHYLKANGQTQVKSRFDVVAISFPGSSLGTNIKKEACVEIIKNAFEFVL